MDSQEEEDNPEGMDTALISAMVQRLAEEVDDLHEALMPLLQGDLLDTTTLPLLDRAKLQILCAYSIESILFCRRLGAFVHSTAELC
jgi:hypothetical protein